MAINFDKHKEALISAWKDVLDEKSETNWALYGYDGQSNDLKFVCKGDGGLTELLDDLNSGKIMYAFLKLDVPDNSISKYVLINWQGEGAPTVRKGTCANHINHVSTFFSGFHLTLHARTEDDLDEKVILDKLVKAGSSFNFKSAARNEELPKSGPVGTAYRKVNPVQDINSKERDQFWIKEEQEEKKRVELERKRREEEKKKAEEDVRRRDELEAAKRAKEEEIKSPSTRDVTPAGLSASETVRRQRSAEAKQLIGHSTANARAMFEQNLAQGQMASRRGSGGVPDKPLRSSVVAARVSALSDVTSPRDVSSPRRPPRAPPAPLEGAPEPLRASPLKNIDKIALSLESPSQIQYEPILDPTTDLSPSSEHAPSFTALNYPDKDYIEPEPNYRDIEPEPMIKQNILENDMFDASYSSGNENDDDDSDNKFSTIKRSPYSKSNIAEEGRAELSRQNTVIENVNYNNGNGTAGADGSPDAQEEGVIYEDLDEDPGLTARALYDYQAADESEITFDPGDVISHIEQIDAGWWQGLGPRGLFGLFPANYVELLPAVPR